MKKRIIALLIAASFMLLNCGCFFTGKDVIDGPEEPTVPPQEPNTENEISWDAELPKELIGKWTFGQQTNGEFLGYRLTCFEDGTVQFEVLNTAAQIKELYSGHWKAASEKLISIELHADQDMNESGPASMNCVYRYDVKNDTLSLTKEKESPDSLISNSDEEPLTLQFYPLAKESESPQENPVLPPVPDPNSTEPNDWDTVGLPKEMMKEWVLTGDQTNRFFLTYFEDGTVQFVVQDNVGQLLGLYHGRWTVIMGGETLMVMLPDEATTPNGRGIECNYISCVKNGYLYLSERDEPQGLLIPHLSGKVLKFASRDKEIQKENLEFDVTTVVGNYYKSVNGEPYPGNIFIEEWLDNETVSVHLYEDMEDHTATAGWYTVNVYTLKGTDDITGEEIDFALYLEDAKG